MRIVALSFLLALTACGVSENSAQKAETVSVNSTVAADKLVGTYAMELYLSTLAPVPIVGGTTRSTGQILRLAHITKTANGYQITEKACDVHLNSDLLKMETPVAETRRSPDLVAKLEVTEKDGVLSVARRGVIVTGAKLANPETDALPTSRSDSRVLNKGIIAKVVSPISGTINYVSRSKNTFNATVEENGVISGTTIDEMDQNIIDASFFLKLSIGKVVSKQDTSGENSVKLVPIEKDATCDSIAFDELFPR